jgi:hypothetical protein
MLPGAACAGSTRVSSQNQEVKMNTNRRTLTLLVIGMLIVPGALYAQATALQPGDSIDGMSFRSGGAEGPPLWAFCSPAFLSMGVTTTECSVPPLLEVAIGHGWFSADEALRDSSWAAMSWELYLDGQQVDLAAFGTYDDDLPQTGLPGHAADEEVITKLRSWDVVLVNPTAGAHVLRSVLTVSQDIDDGFHVTSAGTYDLVVNFTVEAPPPALPETGGSMPPRTLPLWMGVGGLLALTVGLGCLRGIRRAR